MDSCEAEVSVMMNRVATTVCQPRTPGDCGSFSLRGTAALLSTFAEPKTIVSGGTTPFYFCLYWWWFHQYRVLKTHTYSLRGYEYPFTFAYIGGDSTNIAFLKACLDTAPFIATIYRLPQFTHPVQNIDQYYFFVQRRVTKHEYIILFGVRYIVFSHFTSEVKYPAALSSISPPK